MSKSAINILQEYMVQFSKPIPTYNCIGHVNVGLNDHEFTVRVTSGDLSVDAKGSTKKDAKNNAAKEMLLRIGVAGPAELKNNSNSRMRSIIENDMETNGQTFLNSGASLNYVGLLHEYCAQKRILAPTFVEVGCSGPSHMMSFTVKCKVANIAEEATSTTKKNARTEAAKKVYFELEKKGFDPSNNKTVEEKIKSIGVQIKDLKLEEILPDYSKEHEIAKEKYLDLTKLNPSGFVSDKQTLDNCHHLIASKYSLSLRKNVIAQLSEITKDDENDHLLPMCKSVLQKVANILKVELQKISLVSNHTIGLRQHIVGYKLKTVPPIVSICYAKSVCSAEFKAIVDIAMEVQILLS